MVRTRAVGVLWAATVLAATTGCGTYRNVPGPSLEAAPALAHCPQSVDQLPRYTDYGEQIGSGRVPAGFRPVRVVECTWNQSFVDDTLKRERFTVSERRSDRITSEFLTSLELPDQEFARFSDGACPAVAESPRYFILIDADDRAIVPRLPQDPCGGPRDEVAQTFAGLQLSDHDRHRFEGVYPR